MGKPSWSNSPVLGKPWQCLRGAQIRALRGRLSKRAGRQTASLVKGEHPRANSPASLLSDNPSNPVHGKLSFQPRESDLAGRPITLLPVVAMRVLPPFVEFAGCAKSAAACLDADQSGKSQI